MAEESGRKLITPLIFNDESVSRDEAAYFQFEHYADTFARIIAARETRTPLTIGVHGEWGSGKTTLMRRIQAKLDETKDLLYREITKPNKGGLPRLLTGLWVFQKPLNLPIGLFGYMIATNPLKTVSARVQI